MPLAVEAQAPAASLNIDGLTKRFGGLTASDGITLEGQAILVVDKDINALNNLSRREAQISLGLTVFRSVAAPAPGAS
jgi:hypothetical protein